MCASSNKYFNGLMKVNTTHPFISNFKGPKVSEKKSACIDGFIV